MREPVHYCRKCGGANLLNAMVCSHCTEVLDQASPSQSSWTYVSNQETPKSKIDWRSAKVRRWLSAITVILSASLSWVLCPTNLKGRVLNKFLGQPASSQHWIVDTHLPAPEDAQMRATWCSVQGAYFPLADERARNYFDECLNLDLMLNLRSRRVPWTYAAIGYCQSKLPGNLATADLCYKNSIEFYNRFTRISKSDAEQIASAGIFFADEASADLKNNDFTKAQKDFEYGLAVYERLDDAPRYDVTLYDLGRFAGRCLYVGEAFYEVKDYKTAIVFHQAALRLFERARASREVTLEALYSLLLVYVRMQNAEGDDNIIRLSPHAIELSQILEDPNKETSISKMLEQAYSRKRKSTWQ
jgi:tetratricopeptide (TPR) repeat protein